VSEREGKSLLLRIPVRREKTSPPKLAEEGACRRGEGRGKNNNLKKRKPRHLSLREEKWTERGGVYLLHRALKEGRGQEVKGVEALSLSSLGVRGKKGTPRVSHYPKKNKVSKENHGTKKKRKRGIIAFNPVGESALGRFPPAAKKRSC